MTKPPPENTSPEAVALRNAAQAWGAHVELSPRDSADRESQRLNRALLRAAMDYTVRAITGLPVKEINRFAGATDSWMTMLRANGDAVGRTIRDFARGSLVNNVEAADRRRRRT